MDNRITGVEVTEPADVNLDKTVRTDAKTIWRAILEQSVLDKWDSQMHCAEITDRMESEYEEESEKSNTEMQIINKRTVFTGQDCCKLLHSVLSSSNGLLCS